MKTSGIIKLLLIVLNAILIFALPWPQEPDGLITSPTIPFLFMAIIIPAFYLLISKNKKKTLSWPNWNTSLFNPKSDTTFGNADFFGILFTVTGLAMIVSRKMNYDEVSHVGLTSVSFGVGILTGLLTTIIIGKRLNKSKNEVL
jgi:hypothetical protein